jgi:hypothetical protein
MISLMSVILILGLAIAPGRKMTYSYFDENNIKQTEVSQYYPLDDTIINLEGRWGVAVNMGNFDADPAMEIVCRLSEPVPNNTNITRIVVLDDDLTLMWSTTWGTEGNAETPSVTIADIDHDGRDDIIIPMAETFFPDPPTYKCRIYVVDGATGQVKPGWPFIMPGWPEDPYHDVYSEVVAADINNDNNIEIICQTADLNSIRKGGGAIYALSSTGDSLWKFRFYEDTINQQGCWLSPAVCDLDGDSLMEIIVHCNQFMRENPWALIERRLYILKNDGTVLRHWQTEGAGTSYKPDYASPVVGDVNNDGALEIVILRRSGYLDVFNTNGIRLPGFPADLTTDAGYFSDYHTKAFSSPSLADFDGDEQLEIVVGSFGQLRTGAYWGGHIHVFKSDGTALPGFPVPTRNAIWFSPGIGNIDTISGFEILTAGCDSNFYAVDWHGNFIPGYPREKFPTYFLPDSGSFGFWEGKIPMSKTPYLTDVDEDNLTEILMEGADGQLYIWDTQGEYNTNQIPWQTFHFDKERTGWFRWTASGIADKNSTIHNANKTWTYPAGNIIKQGPVKLILHLTEPRQGIISIYCQTGKRIRELNLGELNIGPNTLNLETKGLATGIYFVRVNGITESARLLLIK